MNLAKKLQLNSWTLNSNGIKHNYAEAKFILVNQENYLDFIIGKI